MKKNIIFIILGLFIFSIFLNVINIYPVGADSGFDSSYSSGESSGGSGFGGGSGGHFDISDLSKEDLITLLVIILIIIITTSLIYFAKHIANKFIDGKTGIKISNFFINMNIEIKIMIVLIIIIILGFAIGFNFIKALIFYFLLYMVSLFLNKKRYEKNYINKKNIKFLSNDEIVNLLGKDFDIEKFKKEIFDIYKCLQIAWMDFDYDRIQELVNDEIYNMYINQLETLKIKNQKNIMSEIELISSELIDYKKSNNKEIFKVYMSVECYDYIIDTQSNITVRGNNNEKLILSYILTFERNIDIISKCPQCGADVENLNECKYCNSKIVNNSKNLKMTKKQIVSQK